MEYPNFFESQKEAAIRLHGTVVMLGSTPVEVYHTSQHLGDGIIYAFVRPIGLTVSERADRPEPEGLYSIPHSNPSAQGSLLDKWMESTPNHQMLRVPLNSPAFNRFRPYELGMYWKGDAVYYVERQPNRKTEQGLTETMLVARSLELDETKITGRVVDMLGPEMVRCILGQHPSPSRCIEALTGGKYVNRAAAFHRHFAFLKGPADTLFLVYKFDTIGVLPNGDLSQVRLAKEFAYTKELVDELHLFSDIKW